MNREEAIQYVKEVTGMSLDWDDEHYEALQMAIEALMTQQWISCNKRLPKKNEYVDDVRKYYLIQDEYGDMHVAHISGRGWEPMESIKALGCDVVAWMPLPEPYKGGDSE